MRGLDIALHPKRETELARLSFAPTDQIPWRDKEDRGGIRPGIIGGGRWRRLDRRDMMFFCFAVESKVVKGGSI